MYIHPCLCVCECLYSVSKDLLEEAVKREEEKSRRRRRRIHPVGLAVILFFRLCVLCMPSQLTQPPSKSFLSSASYILLVIYQYILYTHYTAIALSLSSIRAPAKPARETLLAHQARANIFHVNGGDKTKVALGSREEEREKEVLFFAQAKPSCEGSWLLNLPHHKRSLQTKLAVHQGCRAK